MGYATPSDPLLRFAIYSGVAVFLLTVVLLAAIAILRFTSDRRRRIELALARRWQPVFLHAIEGLPFAPPRIHRRDREIILRLWIHFTESIRGDASVRLRQLALDLEFDRTSRELLVRRKMLARLVAIVALGRMKSADAWDQLVDLLTSSNPTLSLLAARSLLQIDASRSAAIVLGEFMRRDDWPLVKVSNMIAEAPREAISGPLQEALTQVSPQNAPRLLSLSAPWGDSWPALLALLSADHPPATLAAALKACSDPRGLDLVRRLATHRDWIVRTQAAATLGRIGGQEDSLRLQAMLSDPEWWVRYRAASALAHMPGVSRQQLTALCAQLSDRFAADILRQVLAETATEIAA